MAFLLMAGFTLLMALVPDSFDPLDGLIHVHGTVKHAITFFALALMLDRFVVPAKQFELWKPLSLLAFGVLIEILQWFTDYRTFSFWDIAADAVGIALYQAPRKASLNRAVI